MQPQKPHEKLPIFGVLTVIHGSLLFVAFGILTWLLLRHWSHTLPEILNMTCSLGGTIFSLFQIVAGSLMLQRKASARSLIDGSALGMAILALIGLGHGLAFGWFAVDGLAILGAFWPLALKIIFDSNASK